MTDLPLRQTPSPLVTWTDRDLQFGIASGVLYFVTVALRDPLAAILGVPPRVTPEYLSEFGTLHVLAHLALRLPAVALMCAAWIACPHGPMRSVVRGESLRAIVWMGVAALSMRFVLNATGMWPFMWRWVNVPTKPYLSALVSGHEWGGIVVWTMLAVLITPLLEELVFRFATLQLIHSWTGSALAAVIVSAVLFSAGHLGSLPPDPPHVVNAAWLFAYSMLIGWLTLRRQGRIMLAITAHAALNGLEVAVLLVVATNTSS